jgi:N-acetylneuraminic acid mutarotase
MKIAAIFLTLVLTFGTIVSVRTFASNAAENSWTTKASMHSSRTGAEAAVVNGIVYVIGGSQRYNTSDTGFSYMSSNPNEAYDPATDTWTQKTPMPTPREGLAAAAFQGKIYCFGGRNVSKDYSISTNLNEVYDTETDSWETKTPMPTARSGLKANEVGGKIYLIGGWIESESSSITDKSNKAEIYDPGTDTWTTGSQIPTPVAGYASAVLDGKIYIISGVASGSTRTNLTQIYDTEKDKWSLGVPIPMSVSSAAAGAITGEKAAKAIYVIGGSNDTYPLNGQYTNQVYFAEANSWVTAAPMPIDRAGLTVAVVNDTLYVMGGGHNIFVMDSTVVMQYTPFAIAFSATEPFPSSLVLVGLAGIALAVIGSLVYLKRRKSEKR